MEMLKNGIDDDDDDDDEKKGMIDQEDFVGFDVGLEVGVQYEKKKKRNLLHDP